MCKLGKVLDCTALRSTAMHYTALYDTQQHCTTPTCMFCGNFAHQFCAVLRTFWCAFAQEIVQQIVQRTCGGAQCIHYCISLGHGCSEPQHSVQRTCSGTHCIHSPGDAGSALKRFSTSDTRFAEAALTRTSNSSCGQGGKGRRGGEARCKWLPCARVGEG